jgi:hypothetical protein
MNAFNIGVYVFIAIAVLIVIVAAIGFYRGKSEEVDGATPIFIPILAIATSGLAIVLIKYVLDTL